MDIMVRSPWANLVGGYSVSLLFHYIDIALLGQWSFHGQPLLKALASGLSLTVNARFIGTSQQVKHISLPSASMSRKSFLWRTAGVIFLSYMALDVMESSADPGMTGKYLSRSNVPFFRRLYHQELSAEEIAVRFFSRAVSSVYTFGLAIIIWFYIGCLYIAKTLESLLAPAEYTQAQFDLQLPLARCPRNTPRNKGNVC
ncbi:hypothetical protein BDW59DRAFT_166946 [Aspergillus cavernicola]|uniref:Uncharacterized protein n=1 Tax=Aspergillus cavernicola TaxID=176166 RepID=A0ABR4HHR8_9EURO